jgi:hypothetical protein
MSDEVLWKYLETTQRILKDIKEEINKSKDEITDGALVVSPALEREYCQAIGYINGLNFIVDMIENVNNDEESSQ